MNNLLNNGVISQLDNDSSFSYILQDNSQFLTTEYKVLQGQLRGGFVRCMRMLFNGHIMLCYLPGGLKPLSALLPGIKPETLRRIIANIFAAVLEVKNNGFLSCQNLDISFERIYVDVSNLKVSLVYMPVSRKNFADYYEFENVLRSELVKLIENNPELQTEKLVMVSELLQEGALGIERLYTAIGGTSGQNSQGAQDGSAVSNGQKLVLVALNAPNRQEMEITKPEFVIGKHPHMADGVILYNRAISRKHCKIVLEDERWYLVDLGSSNHSYINKKRLVPNVPAPISNGDIIRLADSDFRAELS